MPSNQGMANSEFFFQVFRTILLQGFNDTQISATLHLPGKPWDLRQPTKVDGMKSL